MPNKKKTKKNKPQFTVTDQMQLFLDHWFISYCFKLFSFEFNLLKAINIAHLKTNAETTETELQKEKYKIEPYAESSYYEEEEHEEEEHEEEEHEEEEELEEEEETPKQSGYLRSIETASSQNILKKKPTKELKREEVVIKYNLLVKSVNTARSHISTTTPSAWNQRYSQILEYFDTGLKIYEESSKYGLVKGYYYNDRTGKLSFFSGVEGEQPQTVCTLNEKGKGFMRNSFSEITPTNSSSNTILGKIFNTQKSIELTPEKFMNLITIAYNSNDNPSSAPVFHLPISFKFINVVNLITNYFSSKEEYLMQKDYRTEEELIRDITDGINAKIEAYKRGKHTKEKIAIMTAIQKYITTGDNNDLIEEIKKYDSSYVRYSPFPSECYKTLELIRTIKDRSFFDEMLKNRINAEKHVSSKKVTTVEKEKSSLNYIVAENFAQAVNEAKSFWSNKNITRNAYSDLLNKMLKKIDGLLETYEGNEKLNNLRDNFNERLESMQDSSKTSNYNNMCLEITQDILSAVKDSYAKDTGEQRISNTDRTIYNEIGFELYEILNITEMQPEEERVVWVQPTAVRKQLVELITDYESIVLKLTEYRNRLSELEQLEFSNNLGSYIETFLQPRIYELQELLKGIPDIRYEKFNLYGKSLTEEQEKIKTAIKNVHDYSTKLTDELDLVVSTKAVYLEEGVNAQSGEHVYNDEKSDGKEYVLRDRKYESTIPDKILEKNAAAREQNIVISEKYNILYNEIKLYASKLVSSAKKDISLTFNRNTFYSSSAATDTKTKEEQQSNDVSSVYKKH